MARFGSLLAVLVGVLFVAGASATAQDPPALYAVTHLANQSNARATIYFKYRDDNQPWGRVVIERGRTQIFSTNINGPFPTPMIVRLDIDTDGVRYVEHTLTRGPSPDQFSGRWGHHFTIRQLQGTDTRYVHAMTPGAVARLTGREGRP